MEENTSEKAVMIPGEGRPAGPAPLQISPQYVQVAQESIERLRELTKSVLQDGRDYGKVPGVQGKFLWDPGANQILAAFNCYAGKRNILSLINQPDTISVVLEVPLVNRSSGQIVATGVGAATTFESKHRYRWVTNPQEWGYSEEETDRLKKKQDNGGTRYRIENPERDELLNIIVKQASKRAEVDAAEALPGVSSVLKELFGDKVPTSGSGPPGKKMSQGEKDEWSKFWQAVRALGIVKANGTPDQPRAHEMLGVKSMKDWLANNLTLDDAIRRLSEQLQIAAEHTRGQESLFPEEE